MSVSNSTPLPVAQPVNGVPAASINNITPHSRIYFFGKFVQTIIVCPFTCTGTLTFRTLKLLSWVPLKGLIYKVSGFHTESAQYCENEYLRTVKALRDVLFILSVAKRAFQDMIAKREVFVDDIPSLPRTSYMQVECKPTPFTQLSSYLHGVRTFDVFRPEGISEFRAAKEGDLQAVMASHIFKPGVLAINFGLPNVATFMTEQAADGSVQTIKVDAKSLWREKMTFHPTNGKIQSGIFLVPTNLPPEALVRFKQAAEELQGSQNITCVNTNCRVLQAAGFSIEGVAMDGVVFPNTLMEHLLFRNVFFTDSIGVKHKVHFDILNTTSRTLEEHLEEIDTAVVGTRLRHNRRHGDTPEQQEARGAAAKALIAAEAARLAAAGPVQPLDEGLGRRLVTVSVPTFLGNMISRIWGRHTIYEVDLSNRRAEISAAFERFAVTRPDGTRTPKLLPFPHQKPSLITRLKRDFLFCGAVIRFMRRHIMGQVDSIHLHTQDIFNHLKSTKGARLNYVLLDDKVVLARVQANGDNNRTHRRVADWVLSKHAILSGRQDVYCSGEMWYDEARNRFMMNCDSGTYMPSQEHVRVIADLANRIFDSGNIFEAAELPSQPAPAAPAPAPAAIQ